MFVSALVCVTVVIYHNSFCLYFCSANVDTFTSSSPNKYGYSLSEQSIPQKSLITPKASLCEEEQ